MSDITEHIDLPSPAPADPYDMLDEVEREVVDNYVKFITDLAAVENKQLRHYINLPIADHLVNQSRQILKRPLVLSAIHIRLTNIADDNDLAARRVIKEHMAIATSNIADYIVVKEDEDGVKNWAIDILHCSREQLSAVKKITTKVGLYGVQTELELHAKQSSLDALGKMMNLEEADNREYLKFIEPPKNNKPMLESASDEQLEMAYMELITT